MQSSDIVKYVYSYNYPLDNLQQQALHSTPFVVSLVRLSSQQSVFRTLNKVLCQDNEMLTCELQA